MQQRAARTRERLLDAVAEVVDARGYDGASLGEILSVAGVTKGAMYHHFDSKSALVRALIDEQFAPELAPPTVSGMPVLHAAEVSLAALAATVDDVRFRAAFGVVIDRPHADLLPMSWPIAEWARVFAELFTSAAVVGDLGGTVEPRTEAELVVGIVVGQFCVARSIGAPSGAVSAVAAYWRTLIDRAVLAHRRPGHLAGMDRLVRAYQR